MIVNKITSFSDKLKNTQITDKERRLEHTNYTIENAQKYKLRDDMHIFPVAHHQKKSSILLKSNLFVNSPFPQVFIFIIKAFKM